MFFDVRSFTQVEDSVEDNYLHAFEIYNLELNAELAVLSACNTRVGAIVEGEGIMNLARAFFYAGCKSLMMSQWEVSDGAAPMIMESFYTNIKEGKSKAASLRQAKLNYMKNSSESTSNPYLWASMVLVGNDDPIQSKNSISRVFQIIAFVIFIALILYFVKHVVRKPSSEE